MQLDIYKYTVWCMVKVEVDYIGGNYSAQNKKKKTPWLTVIPNGVLPTSMQPF